MHGSDSMSSEKKTMKRWLSQLGHINAQLRCVGACSLGGGGMEVSRVHTGSQL